MESSDGVDDASISPDRLVVDIRPQTSAAEGETEVTKRKSDFLACISLVEGRLGVKICAGFGCF